MSRVLAFPMDIHTKFAEYQRVTLPPRPLDRDPRRRDSTDHDLDSSRESQPPSSTTFSGVVARGFDAMPISVRSERLSNGPASSRFGPSSSRLTPASSPGSQPISSGPRAKGGIYQATRLLDQKYGSFFISRLILTTGINLRSFDASTEDDPEIGATIAKALRPMISKAELDALLPLLVPPKT